MIPQELMDIWEKHGGTERVMFDNEYVEYHIHSSGFEKFCEELAEKAARMGVKLSRQRVNKTFDSLNKQAEIKDNNGN